MELVYCLEMIAGKIDHVVVFEDLDRLPPEDCLYILTRLREINNLVNLRLQKNGEPLRFIYAVNDEYLGSVQHEKFFDYILPVIPEMNRRSAAVLFANKINGDNGIDLDYNVSKEFPQFETVASCLSDYRLQNTILNEYQVLKELYNATKAEGAVLDTPQKNEILAFSIYKNCWPRDYHALRENKSRIFTPDGFKYPDEIKSGKYGKLLEVLTAPENHLLTLHSLYYANFSEETLAKMCADHWKSAIGDPTKHTGIIAELNAIQKDESECISMVREVFNSPSCFYTALDKANTDKQEYYVPLFRAVLKCMVRCEQKDNDWFFNKSHDLKACLHLLAELKSNPDEACKMEFFRLSSGSEKINSNNFFPQFEETDSLTISKLELRELCRGIKSFPTDNISVTDSTDDLETIVKQFRDGFEHDGSTSYFT